MRRSLAGALLALMLAAALICPAWGEDFRPLLENRPLKERDTELKHALPASTIYRS